MDIKSFFKKVVGTIEQEVKTEVDRVKQQQQQQQQKQQQQKPQPAPQAQQQSYEPDHCEKRSEAEWMAYFREILAKEFPQYSVRENVPVQEVAGNVSAEFQLYPTRPKQAYQAEWGLPYTFVLYNAGTVSGVILVGKRQNQSRNVKFLIAKMYAKKMGIPFVSFYMDAPNERDYVVKRMRSHVR